MSARVFIWSQYIDGFVNANALNQLIGFGPDSWKGVFAKYAHNTYVSNLYEYGVVGFTVFIFMFGYSLNQALRISKRGLSKIVAFSIIGFLIMNMATMPLWNIEGLIFFAILISVVLALATLNKPIHTNLYNKQVMRSAK